MTNPLKIPRTYAFEGINGGGKSLVIRLLSQDLERDGLKVETHKISGLGSGQKIDTLKKILNHREHLLRADSLTQQQKNDFLRDRIFRIATRLQIKKFKMSSALDTCDVYLFDRTPLMSWAYSASVEGYNPYLDEILEESLALTATLNIDTTFLLDVDPVTVYTRIICRGYDPDKPLEQQVLDRVDLIDAPREIKERIAEESVRLLRLSPPTDRKAFRIWDYMPYEEVCRQRKNYVKAMEIATERIGLKRVKIDATRKIEEVLGDIKSYLQ